MWLILNKGFLSIVNKEGSFVVRSRVKEHLSYYFPNSEIEEGSGTDYQYRIRLTKYQLDNFFSVISNEITYSNFKDSIKDNSIKNFASQIWILGWQIFSHK